MAEESQFLQGYSPLEAIHASIDGHTPMQILAALSELGWLKNSYKWEE